MGLRELILEDRPLIYWAGDSPRNTSANGATVRDLSGTGRDGAMNDMSELGVPVRSGPSHPEVGFRSDGASTRFINRSQDDAGTNVARVTTECVAYVTSVSTLGTLWSRDNDTTLQWSMEVVATGAVRFSMRESQFGAFKIAEGTTDLRSATPRWYHLVGTWNGTVSGPGPNTGGGRIFVDGVQEAFVSGSANLMQLSTGGVRFGQRLDARFPLIGGYAHMAYYDYAMSAQRIREHARAFLGARYGGSVRAPARLR